MSKRQQAVKIEAELPLLVADIYEAAGLLRSVGEAIAKTEGQSQARWQVLSVISDQPRTVSQAARRLGISRQSVQRVANELEQAGLVGSKPNPEHKASPLIELTLRGSRALERITRQAASLHRDLAPALDAADIETARRTLRCLMDRLEAHSGG